MQQKQLVLSGHQAGISIQEAPFKMNTAQCWFELSCSSEVFFKGIHMRFLFTVFSLLISAIGFAASQSSVKKGFNEPFIQEYGMDQSRVCPDCPTNSMPRSSAEISTALKILDDQNGIATFREIVSLAFLEPGFKGDQQNYDVVDHVMALYRDQNADLILTVGRSFPQWMSASSWCPMPEKDLDWKLLRDSIAGVFARYLTHLNSQPEFADWMKHHLSVEGMNEFDDLLGPDCKSHNLATPLRAAELENSIQLSLKQANINVSYLMPSIAGVYSGYPGVTATELFKNYLRDYYAAKGIGLPNIHLYFNPPQDPTSLVEQVEKILAVVSAAVPAEFQNSIAITEFGAAEQTLSCRGGTSMPLSERNQYYNLLLSNSQIQSQTSFLMLWRLADLALPTAAVPDCEKTHGAMTSDLHNFKPGSEVFLRSMRSK